MYSREPRRQYALGGSRDQANLLHSQVTLDQCHVGAAWRKRARLSSWNTNLGKLDCRCSGRGGLCPRASRHRIMLQGRAPDSNTLWAQLAQGYPGKLARTGAAALVNAADAGQFRRLSDLGGGLRPSAKN